MDTFELSGSREVVKRPSHGGAGLTLDGLADADLCLRAASAGAVNTVELFQITLKANAKLRA